MSVQYHLPPLQVSTAAPRPREGKGLLWNDGRGLWPHRSLQPGSQAPASKSGQGFPLPAAASYGRGAS